MIIIPDANSIISALIKKGKSFDLFEWNDFKKEILFVAPENLSLEIRQNISSISKKSDLSKQEIVKLLNKIELQIEFVPAFKFKKFISDAIKISPPNDFPYIALGLFLKSEGKNPRILSNDKALLISLSKIDIEGVPLHKLLFELGLV